MDLRIPGRVWYDALDPMTTGMEAELGLPTVEVRRRGRGVTMVYYGVTSEQADEVAEHLEERAWLMTHQSALDPNERELYRIMDSTAKKIKRALREAGFPAGSLASEPLA